MRLSIQTASPKPARYEHTNLNNYFQKLEYGNNDSVEYTYDKQGQAKYADCDIVICNAATYHYVKNLQGDVMSIVDAQGAVVASYNYDPYGNLISDEPAENTVGHLNPLRYRGYYYDSESELYYLQSRYYDPEIGRFLNADAFVSTGQGLLGNNMYVYCLNSPVICIDRNGKRTYVINGIGNDNDDEAPEYMQAFCAALEEAGVENVSAIAVYTGQTGLLALIGLAQVVLEMINIDVYSDEVFDAIQQDLAEHPLEDGEQLNIIGYSGGGQLALNVAEMLGDQVDNVILIGAPVAEIKNGNFTVSAIYSPHDIFSWNISMGVNSYNNGRHGHGGYFKKSYMERTVENVLDIID